MGILADLVLKLRHVLADGVATPDRSTINFIGGTVTDNPVEGRIDVTIGSGVATLGVTAPILNTGTSSDPVVAISAATTGALGSMKCAGDLGGSGALPSVLALRGAVVGTAAGALTTGRVLRVTGASACDWGALDLANAAAVTGVLPVGNVEATATPTASKIAKWGASIDMGAALLYDSAGGTVPATGFINVGATSTIVAGHSASGTATRLLLRWAAAKLFVGEESDEMQLDAVNAAHLGVSGSKSIYVTASGIQIFGAGSVDFASGVGVIGLASAGTEPSTNPAAGKAVAWLYGGALKMRSPKGLVSTLARDADGTQALQVDDRWWRTVQTTDVAAAVATYADALPVNAQFVLELNVCGIQHGTDTRCHFKVIASGGRAAGGMTVDATDVQTIFDAIGVSGVPTVTNSSDRPQLNCLGKAATTIDWTSFGTIRIVAPTP